MRYVTELEDPQSYIYGPSALQQPSVPIGQCPCSAGLGATDAAASSGKAWTFVLVAFGLWVGWALIADPYKKGSR